MLCEMRGYEGSMSGWNGSEDGSRGLCVFRKMEIGAYVVNSNQASGRNSYYQGENDSDVVFAHHESSRHPGYPDTRRQELRSSKLYVSQHPDKDDQKRQMLREKRQPDYVNTSTHQLAMSGKYSSSNPQLSNTSDNQRISTQEKETTQSTEGSVAGNIFQGPIVRVQVPEVYYEGGSTRGTETAVAYRHNTTEDKGHEQTSQHLQRARATNEIHTSPVSETYRRINEWLKNCQQHSSTSLKSSQVSYGSNHSRTDNKLKQNTNSGNFSKPEYRMPSQTGNFSNLKLKPNEPRFIASLEPKVAKTGNVILLPNHQHRHRNSDWTEQHEVSFRHENQSSAQRTNDITSAFSSNFNHVVNTTKSFYESEWSRTPSEWSSETLSIVGSDKSSYCTDFTPFELGSADNYGGRNQMSTSASECPPTVGINVLASHVMIDDRMLKKNVGVHPKEFSEALHDSVGNEFNYNRRNDKNNFNSGWNSNSGQKSKQQKQQGRLTDKLPKTPIDFEASSQTTSKTGRVVTVFIGEMQRTLQGNPQLDNITKQKLGAQNNVGYQKATADPVSSSKDVHNLNISDRRVLKGDRKSAQVPSDAKLYRSDRKPMNSLRCTSLEHPLPTRFSDKDHPFSIPVDNGGYKESSDKSETDSALQKQLNSRPDPQLRGGSLSITIRPNRLTVMDYFKKIDDVWDSSGRKELTGTVELSSDIGSLHNISYDRPTDAKAVDIGDDSNGFNSGSDDDVSDESEELDEFTKTVIKADISGKSLQSSSNAEFPSKPQYNVLKQSKNLKPSTSTLLADVHSRFAGKGYPMLDDKNTEEEGNIDLKEQAMFKGDIPLNSVPYCSVSQGQLQDRSYSSKGWLPGKSAGSPDLQMKITKNYDIADDGFGRDSEYMNCKYEDMPETEHRLSSEKKHNDMYSLASDRVSRNSYPEFQSFIKNNTDLQNFIYGDIKTPDGSADRMAPAPDELYTDDRSHMGTASPRSLRRPTELFADAFHNHLELESVRCSNAMPTDNKTKEEDKFLMSLLQSQTPDLPAYKNYSTPHMQSRNLGPTSDFMMRSGCGGDSELMPFRYCTDQFDKEAASNSEMKSPKTFEKRELWDKDPNSLDFKLLTHHSNESPKEGGKGHSEESYQQKSQDAEYSKKLLKNDSSDSLLYIVVDGASTPAAIPRCQSQKSDSMTHEDKDGERQGNSDCSKLSEHYADASFIIDNAMKNSEPMSCQELIDFPENLVIAPPESFSDFTIML